MTKKLCIVVVGPTSSGKSELAVAFAKKYNGEIISADSRQIYKGMDIGSGKVEGIWKTLPKNSANPTGKVFIYKNIPHYLIDEASPRSQYSVAQFQKKARRTIEDIYKRGKVPIICGGTAQWVDALAFNQSLPEVKPNLELRRKLESKTSEQLFRQLQKLDPNRALTIDKQNPRRLIRALEIILTTGKPVPKVNQTSDYNLVWIGLNPADEILQKNINTRLHLRIKQGMMEEVNRLHQEKVSWKKLESFGLEYKFCALLLQNKINKSNFTDLLEQKIKQYAKRQMTWWKRNKNIQWFEQPQQALNYIQDFFRNEANK